MRLTSVVLALFITVFAAFSQSTAKIKELENKRKLAMKEIENTTVLLSEAKKSTANLLNRIKLITEQINSRQQLISLLNEEIAAITEQQSLTEKEIKVLEADLKEEQKAYSKAVEGMVLRKQKASKLLFVLSGKSFGESMRRMKYLKDYSNWRSEKILEIKEKHKILEEKKAALQKSKSEKEQLLHSRQQEHINLQNEEQQQKIEVSEANKKQAELQSILQKNRKQAENLNAQIERLIAEEVARQEREAKRQAEEKARREKARREAEQKKKESKEKSSKKESNKAESKTESKPDEGFAEAPAITRENTQLSSNFASNKGKFPMPVSGRYRIVGRFGTHKHNQWNVTTNSSGIDIQAQSGAQARAVFNGEVSRVVAFPGYNNCIIIRHGNYYTFYGNIQNVSVRPGQKVTTGQSLGSVYTDSDTGMSQLHFQLWHGTSKLNPEPWLQK